MFKEQSILLLVYYEENDRICKGMISLMEIVVQRMGQIEEVFIVLLFFFGSVVEGIKIGNLNEFDFIFCLIKFVNVCIIVEDENFKISGLVKVRFKIKLLFREFFYFFDDLGFILI